MNTANDDNIFARRKLKSPIETWKIIIQNTGRYSKEFKIAVLQSFFAAFFQGLALACIVPFFIAIFEQQNKKNTIMWLIIMAILMTATLIFRWSSQGFDCKGKMQEAVYDLYIKIGKTLRNMPLEKLQEKRSGEVNSLLIGSVNDAMVYAVTAITIIFNSIVTPVTVAIALLIFDWRLGLLILLVFPLILPLYLWRRPALGVGMRVLDDAHKKLNSDIVEYVQSIPMFRACNCEGEKAESLQKIFDYIEEIQVIGHKKGGRPNIIMATTMELGLLAVLIIGVVLVYTGSLSIFILSAIFVIMMRFAEPLATFVLYTTLFEILETATEKINKLLKIKPLKVNVPTETPTKFYIDIENLYFKYLNTDKYCLKGVNAKFIANGLTAIVGPSGSGKTTISKMIMRFADPEQGKIKIGGIDIKNLNSEYLCNIISVVFQDVYLFDDTIIENIRMAKPSATIEEVENAAKLANCHEFVTRFEEGYQTQVGNIGAKLSGGERQRISIARAILKDSPIVILDEPTAALDTESEILVQKAIESLIKDKTVIVIAHRLSTIVAADCIHVLEDGKITESGTHQELLNNKQRYYKMWQAQISVKEWQV